MTDIKPTSVVLHPEDRARFPLVKQKTAVIETLLLGRASKGVSMADVFRRGLESYEAEIARQWTPEHEALLGSAPAAMPGKSRLASGLVAESRARGFGPDTPLEGKKAEAARLGGLKVSDEQVARLLGVSRQRVAQWRERSEVSGRQQEAAMIADAMILHERGQSCAEIGKALGVSRQQADYWLRKAAEDKLARARSRNAGNGAVKHVTPGGVPFRAPGQAS